MPTRPQIETAIHAWITSTSGLAADRVMWSLQKAPQPAKPFIEMRIRRNRAVGLDWVDSRESETPTPGAELEYIQRGVRVVTLELRCFGESSVGSSEATEILETVRSRSMLPSIADPLDTAEIGIGSFDDVQSIDGIVNSTILEPRALLSIQLFLAQEKTETGTYIETVELEGTIST